MTYPADQTTRRAEDVRAGDWVHDGHQWRAVAAVETVGHRTAIHLEPLVYDADENIGVCTAGGQQ